MLIIFLIFTFFSFLNVIPLIAEEPGSFMRPLIKNKTDKPIKIVIEFNCPSGKIKKLGTLIRRGRIPLKYGPVILEPGTKQIATPTPITKKDKTWTWQQAIGLLSIQTYPLSGFAGYHVKHEANPENSSGLIISLIPDQKNN
ncbi:MAG: hypothetical protein WDZ41_00855 [Candidatus Babeliales bacterium]